MFSGNQKISCRQLYRNYTAGLISLGALLAPLAMNRENLTQILWALLFLGDLVWARLDARGAANRRLPRGQKDRAGRYGPPQMVFTA